MASNDDEQDLTIEVVKLDPLVQKAYRDPRSIERILGEELLVPDLALRLGREAEDLVSETITPSIKGAPPTRTATFFASCFIMGTLLGQAYRLLAVPSHGDLDLTDAMVLPLARLPQELRDQIYGYYLEVEQQRARVWDAIQVIYMKALIDGLDPEPGGHYVAAMITLSCGKALSQTPNLQGRGRRWLWYSERCAEPHHVWDWTELKEALLETSKLPRNNTDYKQVLDRYDYKTATLDDQYVSKENLDALDAARAHVIEGADDWSAAAMADRFLEPLFSAPEERLAFAVKDEPEPGWPDKAADQGSYWYFS